MSVNVDIKALINVLRTG